MTWGHDRHKDPAIATGIVSCGRVAADGAVSSKEGTRYRHRGSWIFTYSLLVTDIVSPCYNRKLVQSNI